MQEVLTGYSEILKPRGESCRKDVETPEPGQW